MRKNQTLSLKIKMLKDKNILLGVTASIAAYKATYIVRLLKKLGASYVKIASTDLTNHSLIGEACSNFNNIVISTGMAEVSEIASTVSFVKNNYPKNNLRLMHCVSLYPCPLEKANLKRIQFLISRFNLEIGYSDHTRGNVSSAMAIKNSGNSAANTCTAMSTVTVSSASSRSPI